MSTQNKGTTKKKTNATTKVSKVEEPVVNETVVEATVEEPDVEPAVEEKKSYRVKASLDPNMIVTVKNGFNGILIYKSKKTGEIWRWDEFGSEQDIELSELKNARNNSKDFFINNWFLFDDPEVIDWLGVTQYYKFALNHKEFDELFERPIDEVVEVVATLPAGQRKTLIYRAKQLISEGVIDSRGMIVALEDVLGVELIER